MKGKDGRLDSQTHNPKVGGSNPSPAIRGRLINRPFFRRHTAPGVPFHEWARASGVRRPPGPDARILHSDDEGFQQRKKKNFSSSSLRPRTTITFCPAAFLSIVAGSRRNSARSTLVVFGFFAGIAFSSPLPGTSTLGKCTRVGR